MNAAPYRRRGLSFRVKLAAGISALALGIVIVLGVTLTDIHVDDLERELDRKGQRYVRMLGRELEQVVAFDDRLTAREVFASMAIDTDLETVAVYAADGHLIEGRGLVSRSLAAGVVRDPHTYTGRVTSLEGPTGTVVVQLGTGRLDIDRRRSITTSLVAAAVTAGIAFLLAFWLARSVTRRLERIARGASIVASGNLDQPPIEPGADDEIGSVAIAFNAMVGDLRSVFEERQLAAITEQERLTELVAARTAQLVDSREQYRLIAETTNAVPFTYDPGDDRFSYIGPQCARVLGYAPMAMRAAGFLDTLVEPAALASVRAALTDPLTTDFELELTVVSGGGRSMHLRMIASRDDSGADACVRGLILDMTEHRRLELELAQAQKLESVGRLAAGIAHEINTPTQFVSDNVRFIRDAIVDGTVAMERLRALRTCLGDDAAPGSALAEAAAAADQAIEAADLDYLTAEMPKGVDAALEGLGRIATIVRAMREFAHPTQGGFDGADLNQALRSTLTVARNEYRYVADLDLELAELPPVHCDVNAFNQAVLNIVVNAAHAIGEVADGAETRGKITVTSGIDGDSVVVSITDTGKGIPVHVRDRIFDPFFTTKEVGKGTGQGLSIARAAIVEKHGGSLTFDTVLGRGTTFHIRLPIGARTDDVAAAAA